jgi:predicted amidophosphoribosyltransferase
MTCPSCDTDRRQQPDGVVYCERCGKPIGRMAHDKAGQRYTVPLLDEKQEAVRLGRLDRVG